jgi:outer membrane protein assembly factor BamB
MQTTRLAFPRFTPLPCPALTLALTLTLLLSGARAAENWPDFRGPDGDGRCRSTALPLAWSETQNVVWKTAISGRGWSSPVVWEHQVWLTTATEDGQRMFAIGVDKDSGRIVHHVQVFAVDQPQPIDPLNSYASPSPVIEQDRVYVHFGTYGTACLDTRTGAVLWKRNDLPVDHQKGPGSSPILFQDRLIFQCDGNDVQTMVALDTRTGRTIWSTQRSIDLSRRAPDYRKSFSTPLILPSQDGTELISTAAGGVYAYDPSDGRERWRVRYPGHTNVSRPVADDRFVVINTGYPRPELWAVRRGGAGDITDTHVAWRVTQGVPIKPSVILDAGLIYMVSDTGGVATCLDVATGDVVWKERLGGNYSASPLLADGRLYCFSQEGLATIVNPGRDYDVLAVNRLDNGFMASPAVSGTALYLRSTKHLYRIETTIASVLRARCGRTRVDHGRQPDTSPRAGR